MKELGSIYADEELNNITVKTFIFTTLKYFSPLLTYITSW